MPAVRYVGNAQRFKLTSAGLGVAQDDPEVEVEGDVADYLLEETDQFERVGGDGDLTEQIAAGECPWCDEYEGDAVGQHASSAHPDEWDAYKED